MWHEPLTSVRVLMMTRSSTWSPAAPRGPRPFFTLSVFSHHFYSEEKPLKQRATKFSAVSCFRAHSCSVAPAPGICLVLAQIEGLFFLLSRWKPRVNPTRFLTVAHSECPPPKKHNISRLLHVMWTHHKLHMKLMKLLLLHASPPAACSLFPSETIHSIKR